MSVLRSHIQQDRVLSARLSPSLKDDMVRRPPPRSSWQGGVDLWEWQCDP